MSDVPTKTFKSFEEMWKFAFGSVQKHCYKIAKDHGFHSTDAGNPARIALCHSELSECLEALRTGNKPDDHLPQFDGAVVELADVIIRVMDLAEKNRWPLSEAIWAKMKYNEQRPYKHGGKRF